MSKGYHKPQIPSNPPASKKAVMMDLERLKKEIVNILVAMNNALLVIPNCRHLFDVNKLNADKTINMDVLDQQAMVGLGNDLIKQHTDCKATADILAVKLNNLLESSIAGYKNDAFDSVVFETELHDLVLNYNDWADTYNDTVHATILKIIDVIGAAKITDVELDTSNVVKAEKHENQMDENHE